MECKLPLYTYEPRYSCIYRFLLAQLHLDSLIRKRSRKAVKIALAKLSSGSEAYDHAYQSAMERIEEQVADQKELAKQILSWIICAKRPITTSELQQALVVEIGESQLDGENLPQIEDMVSACAGLVTINEESDVIRLVHYTTQEYFERTQKQWFPNTKSDITDTCVTYLSFSTFDSGYCHDLEATPLQSSLRLRRQELGTSCFQGYNTKPSSHQLSWE